MNSALSEEWKARSLILLCAAAALVPLLVRGNSCGHDFDFHLESWLEAARHWHEGVFYPHWAASANYGVGEPRFVFYPPLSWMLGTALGGIFGSISGGWSAAPIAYTFIAFAASGLSLYRLARRLMPRNPSALAACIYIVNPYMLFVAYERTAYGELLAAVWLPLILLLAIEAGAPELALSLPKGLALASQEVASKPGAGGLDFGSWFFAKSPIASLALAIAAVWLTNAPAAVMSCYLLAFIAIWGAIEERRWQPLFSAAAGGALGMGLAAFYIIPAAYERRWVEIGRVIGPGMRVEDSFLFGRTGGAFHDQVLRTASWTAVAIIVTVAVAIAAAWKIRPARPLLRMLALLTASICFLLLPASEDLWQLAPELRFLQFPWRWLLVMEVVLGLAIGIGVAGYANLSSRPEGAPATGAEGSAVFLGPRNTARGKFPPTPAIAAFLAALTMVLIAADVFWQPCDDEDAVSAQLAVFREGGGFEGTDEYTPIDADNSIIQRGLPQVRLLSTPDAGQAPSSDDPSQQNPEYVPSTASQPETTLQIQHWSSERKAFIAQSSTSAFAVLKLMDYPAWRVRVNGAPIERHPHRDDGLLVVPLQPGQSEVEVTYATTQDVLWGRTISLFSVLMLLATTARERRKSLRLS